MTIIDLNSKTPSQPARPRPMPESCDSCRFAKSALAPNQAMEQFCAIKAPQAFPMQTQGGMIVMAVQPPTPRTKWCGDWKGVEQ